MAMPKGSAGSVNNNLIAIVIRQLECVRDERRCRDLMEFADNDKTIIALDNLRQLIARERKSYH